MMNGFHAMYSFDHQLLRTVQFAMHAMQKTPEPRKPNVRMQTQDATPRRGALQRSQAIKLCPSSAVGIMQQVYTQQDYNIVSLRDFVRAHSLSANTSYTTTCLPYAGLTLGRPSHR